MKCFEITAFAMSRLSFSNTRCLEPARRHYLCEFGATQLKKHSLRGSKTLLPHIRKASLREYPIDHVICPEGHVTHSLFSCETHYSCWSQRHHFQLDTSGLPSERSCPAPMTQLPPYFRCQSQVQVVAYTVVCDHRQDCADGSDEDFCQFPACRRDSDIMCNKQVSL